MTICMWCQCDVKVRASDKQGICPVCAKTLNPQYVPEYRVVSFYSFWCVINRRDMTVFYCLTEQSANEWILEQWQKGKAA